MNSYFSAAWGKNLTLSAVRKIENQLTTFDVTKPAELSLVSEELRLYFSSYGFDALMEEHPCSYCLGYLHLPAYRFVVHSWQQAEAKGTVLVSHGLFDHVGLYLSLVNMLLAAGYSVMAIDFPGHGLSEGEPAVISDFEEYGFVIETTIDAMASFVNTPIYAIGQSTGGAALLNYVLREPTPIKIEKLILMAPLLRPKGWRKVNLLYILLRKFIRFVPRNFSVNSHDKVFIEFLKHFDPLQPKKVSVQWTGAMRQWVMRFASLPGSELPLMIIQGDKDDTVDWEYNLPAISKKFKHSEIVMVEDAMHHLVNEGDAWRVQVFNSALRFLEKKPLV
ncbi:MAG: alpha-beta hydrolase superfamily lysophospholipase [Lentisphaeria bacterium]|jgi:alpha-beta hydrolase superfamily lysophospholipase